MTAATAAAKAENDVLQDEVATKTADIIRITLENKKAQEDFEQTIADRDQVILQINTKLDAKDEEIRHLHTKV